MNMNLHPENLKLLPVSDRESVRMILIGSQEAVSRTIRHLHTMNLADPNDWSPLQRVKHSTEVISLLIKRV